MRRPQRPPAVHANRDAIGKDPEKHITGTLVLEDKLKPGRRARTG
jgi:hypothetical protein